MRGTGARYQCEAMGNLRGWNVRGGSRIEGKRIKWKRKNGKPKCNRKKGKRKIGKLACCSCPVAYLGWGLGIFSNDPVGNSRSRAHPILRVLTESAESIHAILFLHFGEKSLNGAEDTARGT